MALELEELELPVSGSRVDGAGEELGSPEPPGNGNFLLASAGLAEGCIAAAGDFGDSVGPPILGAGADEESAEPEPGNGKRSTALGALEPTAGGFGVVPHGSGSGITEQGFGSGDGCCFELEEVFAESVRAGPLFWALAHSATAMSTAPVHIAAPK